MSETVAELLVGALEETRVTQSEPRSSSVLPESASRVSSEQVRAWKAEWQTHRHR
jgi:hypothetical protein